MKTHVERLAAARTPLAYRADFRVDDVELDTHTSGRIMVAYDPKLCDVPGRVSYRDVTDFLAGRFKGQLVARAEGMRCFSDSAAVSVPVSVVTSQAPFNPDAVSQLKLIPVVPNLRYVQAVSRATWEVKKTKDGGSFLRRKEEDGLEEILRAAYPNIGRMGNGRKLFRKLVQAGSWQAISEGDKVSFTDGEASYMGTVTAVRPNDVDLRTDGGATHTRVPKAWLTLVEASDKSRRQRGDILEQDFAQWMPQLSDKMREIYNRQASAPQCPTTKQARILNTPATIVVAANVLDGEQPHALELQVPPSAPLRFRAGPDVYEVSGTALYHVGASCKLTLNYSGLKLAGGKSLKTLAEKPRRILYGLLGRQVSTFLERERPFRKASELRKVQAGLLGARALVTIDNSDTRKKRITVAFARSEALKLAGHELSGSVAYEYENGDQKVVKSSLTRKAGGTWGRIPKESKREVYAALASAVNKMVRAKRLVPLDA